MKAWFDSPRAMKSLAIALLLLALPLIGVISYGRYQLNRMPLLKAMLPINEEAIWLVFDNEIWLVDVDGHRVALKTLEQLGISGKVSAITVTAAGKVLVGSNAGSLLSIIDPATFSVSGRLALSWPPEFGGADPPPVFLATAPNGDILLSFAGGPLLLFARDGSFKASTSLDSKDFLASAFHSSDGWWVTQRDGLTLRLFDGQTLKPLEQIELRQPGPYPLVGYLTLSQGRKRYSASKQEDSPIVTVARMAMTESSAYVSDVFSDGRFIDYPSQALGDSVAFGWFDGRLLIIDNESLRIQRFNSARKLMTEFGDDALRKLLADIRQERAYWKTLSSHYLLMIAIILTSGSVIVFRRYAQLKICKRQGEPRTWRVGTPEVSTMAYVRFQLMLLTPAFLCMIGIFLLSKFLQLGHPVLRPLLFTEMGLAVMMGGGALIYLFHLLHRCAADPYYEALLNRSGVAWLNEGNTWARLRQPAEEPCESTMLLHRLSVFWLLLTTRRILLLKCRWGGHRLQKAWPREAIDEVVLLPAGRLLLRRKAETIRGRCPSTVTAERITTSLQESAAVNAWRIQQQGEREQPDAGRHKNALPVTHWYRNPWLQCLASAMMPGLGQFMQSRFSTGLYFFIGSTVILMFLIFLIWTSLWTGASSVVPLIAILPIVSGWLVFVCIGIRDVWRFARESIPAAEGSRAK